MEKRIKIPPIVGVPDLLKCVCGPSSLICWVRLNCLSLFIIQGARTKLIKRAVIAASAVLKVIYRNTLKGKKNS
jgi:hypothetical protein